MTLTPKLIVLKKFRQQLFFFTVSKISRVSISKQPSIRQLDIFTSSLQHHAHIQKAIKH